MKLLDASNFILVISVRNTDQEVFADKVLRLVIIKIWLPVL